MNIQSLVVIVLRLMALDFLLRVAVQLTPEILAFVHLYARPSENIPHSFVALPILVFAGLIAFAVILWFLALRIARFVTRGVPPDLSIGVLSLADCYSIAFIGVGLFYISSHLPQVMNWAHYLLKMSASSSGDSWKEQVRWYDVSQAVITFIMGVVLFVNGRRWAVALARRDAASAASQASVSETNEAGT